jgi:hypothetical protein
MRSAPSIWPCFQAAAAAALVLCFLPACKPAAAAVGPPKPAAPRTNAVALGTNQISAEYVSVFEQLMPPKGRDPFFPNSHRRDPVPVMAVVEDKPMSASELVLKGIVGAHNHRMAVINNVILEAGESGTVRVASGRMRVKCLEIGEDSAVIEVAGQMGAKRLELSKKGN